MARISPKFLQGSSTAGQVLTSNGAGVAPSYETVQAIAVTNWTNALSSQFTFNNCGTTTDQNIFTRRVGDTLQVKGSVTLGTVAAATMSISLPSGYVIDSTKLPSNVSGTQLGLINDVGGSSTQLFTSSVSAIFFYDGSDTSNIYCGYTSSGSGSYTKNNANSLWNSNEQISFEFSIPIDGWSSIFIGASNSVAIAYIKDIKSAGTAGGTATSGSWETRDLNTLIDPSSIVTSLSSNQFALPIGTYQIEVIAPSYSTSVHKAKLYDITNAADVIIGSSEYAFTGGSNTSSKVCGILTLTTSTTFEVRHQVGQTVASNGYGVECNFGVDEVYTQIAITKLS